ncbi:MAG: glycoside hydrolase family 97 protein, partial [Prevotella sp.]|nr:glycoside hydrolase family 97 protein [Prevotella sp.]
MKKFLTISVALLFSVLMYADTDSVVSPDGRLKVNINTDGGVIKYDVEYDGKQMLKPSRLGLLTDMGDFTSNLSLKEKKNRQVDETYTMSRTKASSAHYQANAIDMQFTAKGAQHSMKLIMQVSNNDIAYRYYLTGSNNRDKNEARRVTVLSEASSFCFPEKTTTFLCPQIDGDHKGWMNTKPSYEEDYKADASMTDKSLYGVGYTFPCLFRVGDDGWVLVSETGVGSNYCGSHLSDYDPVNGYKVDFPHHTENRGLSASTPAFHLPAYTPWRTITVGANLKPIVETTISYDVVKPLYEPRQEYKPGRYTWSWLVWQDNSINWDDQIKFIDTAAEMGYEYCLVDNFWDETIGRERMAKLSEYAQKKGVSLMLWYNSNGGVNDAPQTPYDCMNTSIAREREMSWLESIGVKGIKVDFFGGDKQVSIQQYEDILSDANRHGLQVIFHGCTLPRGWERMYPNFVASEAVLASENVFFSDYHAKQQGFELTMHPFSRNAVASMDWGGTIMNRYLSKDNKSRHQRYTTDVFEIASAIVNQTSIQCIAIQPNNLAELPQFELDILKKIPTTWDETVFLEGFPTHYIIEMRRSGDDWYVAGLNGTDKPIITTLSLPQFAGQEVSLYADNVKKKGETVASSFLKKVKVDKSGRVKVTLQPMGGLL